jgi:hypothetical protein
MRPLSLVIPCLPALCLVACQSQDPRIPAFQQKVEALTKTVETLTADLETLKQERELDKNVLETEGDAYLTPGSEGYSLFHIDLGQLTVNLQDVRPYANGSKILLQFGNPTSATIEGLKVTLEWGRVDAKGRPVWATAKSREISFNTSLAPGAFTNVPVTLEAVPPSELGFVQLHKATHRGIGLRRPGI